MPRDPQPRQRRSERWGAGMWPHHKLVLIVVLALLVWNALGTIEPWAVVGLMAAWVILIVWETR